MAEVNTKQEEMTSEIWFIVEDETTTGERCFVAYDLMRDGCMAQGKTREEAFLSLQFAKMEWDRDVN